MGGLALRCSAESCAAKLPSVRTRLLALHSACPVLGRRPPHPPPLAVATAAAASPQCPPPPPCSCPVLLYDTHSPPPSMLCRFTCPVQVGNSYRAAAVRARGRRCFDHNHYSKRNMDVRFAGVGQGELQPRLRVLTCMPVLCLVWRLRVCLLCEGGGHTGALPVPASRPCPAWWLGLLPAPASLMPCRNWLHLSTQVHMPRLLSRPPMPAPLPLLPCLACSPGPVQPLLRLWAV